MRNIVLFVIPFLLTTLAIVGYFLITQKISTIAVPALPSISVSDLVKYSRFSLSKAPSESLVGTITSMSGEVNYEPRTATVSARIFAPVTVQQGESLSTGDDGKLLLTFDNSAEVDLFPGTLLNIVQTLPADLVFSQSLGTAEFKKLAEIPVSIRVFHLLIEDRGEVTISIDKVKPLVTVSVKSGSIDVAYNDIHNITRFVTVEAGRKMIFNDATRRVTIGNI